MKINLIASVLALSSTLLAGYALASDGNVHFRGEIIDSSCEIASESNNQIVSMGKVNKTSFSGTGSTSAAKEFDIKLTKCPATYTKAAITFDGTEASDGNGDLAVGNPLNDTTPGDYTGADGTPVAATGVAVRIYNRGDNSQVELHKDSASVDITNGTAQIGFIARYIATSDTVTPGTANADAQFTIQYVK